MGSLKHCDTEPAHENYYICMKLPYGPNTFTFTFKATQGGNLKGEFRQR